MSELDDVLRQSFARIAEPGDPAGVADGLRTRLAAGDTGTPAATSGFRSSTDRIVPWLFGGAFLLVLVAVVTLTAIVGGALQFVAPDSVAGPTTVAPSQSTAPLNDTPSPTPSPSSTLVESAAPVETPEPAPVPPADTTSPKLSTPTVSPDEVWAMDSDGVYCDIATTITAVATDNVGVTGIRISWSGVESGSAEMTAGASWTFAFNPADATPTGDVVFVLVARDRAGNTSATATTTVKVWDYCLI